MCRCYRQRDAIDLQHNPQTSVHTLRERLTGYVPFSVARNNPNCVVHDRDVSIGVDHATKPARIADRGEKRKHVAFCHLAECKNVKFALIQEVTERPRTQVLGTRLRERRRYV